MTRKAMSIIGRIIGLLLVVAIAFFASWCIANPAEAEAEWNKIFNKTPQQEQPNEPDQPTPDKPSEEQISLDGLYYINVDGDYSFVQIKDGKYGIIDGYIEDSKIYLVSDWESRVELNPFHTTEDDKYLHVFVTDQVNSNEYKIAIYDKTTEKLYYDFSSGEQFPGETYEDQLLFEMVKFDEYEFSDSSSEVCEHDWVEDLSYIPTAPSCGGYWDTQYKCSKCNETKLETNGPLPHDYVNGVCSRCGETDPNHVVAPVSLDGMYYFITPNGTVCVNQIEGDKFTQFNGYFKNGEQSVIYLPQDYETYIDVGYTLSITETDTNIVASIVEIPAWGEAFNYDKTTQTLYFCGSPTTKITNFEILPYEEPTFSIVDNKLLLSDMTQYEGTYNIYYTLLNGSEGEDTSEYAYAAGNVTEFDLNLLINRDYMPMLVGRDYKIRVVFQTGDGFNLYVGVASYTASVDSSELTLSVESISNNDFWYLVDVSEIEDYLLNNCGDASCFNFSVGFYSNGYCAYESSHDITLSDFGMQFGNDSFSMSYLEYGSYSVQIVVTSDNGYELTSNIVDFNHDGGHYLLKLSV